MTSTSIPTTAAPVSWDPFSHAHDLNRLRGAVLARDALTLRHDLLACSSADDLTFLLLRLAELPGVEELAEQAFADRPDDPLVRTLRAARYVTLAWEARGSGRASSVSAQRFERFHDLLRRAEQILIDVCAERPDFAPAWTFRLTTARGLELGLAEARRRFARLAVHHPHHGPAQVDLLQTLCPKWSGTWPDALGFAREQADAAPPGTASGALIPMVHLETWLLGDETVAPIRSVDVRDEMRAAAARSVWHPGAQLGLLQVAAHSAFALAFSVGGHLRDAAPHFDLLAGRGDAKQWGYVNNPTGAYLRYREAARAAAERKRR